MWHHVTNRVAVLFLLGKNKEEGFKPIPGKALLPVLQEVHPQQPTPPPGPPPTTAIHPISKSLPILNFTKVYMIFTIDLEICVKCYTYM